MSRIVRGGLYKHYSNKKIYEVLEFAKHHQNLKVWVVYKGLYNHESLGNEPVFIREIDDFSGKVDGKDRFERIYTTK